METADDSDEALMLRYKSGDASGFDILYSRHKGGLFRYFLRQCGDRAQAEELFQDVWMNLIRARSRYEVQARFTTYLYSLAHNRLMDFFRKKRIQFVEVNELENIADCTSQLPEERAAMSEQMNRLLSLLQTLPPPQREAFLLHEEAGLDVEEIAAATGVAKEAAKSRLRYAVQKLREGLRE
ncbi:MAG TPA: sigma-70 family RNA polymerase sigma factor [Burkholderiales bacterium]|nr:sigma-70 family RNA polymerase sigma factor [Burkholderiales bacterium]